MTRYFLDTNVCLDLLSGTARGRNLPPLAQCVLSSVVEAELWAGVYRAGDPTRARQMMLAFVESLRREPFDAAAGETYGEVRASLERAGSTLGVFDQMVAAHAKSAGATLITGNHREFRQVSGLACYAWE